jgi:hypothetical protein
LAIDTRFISKLDVIIAGSPTLAIFSHFDVMS